MSHPEDFCDICGDINFSWVVDSDRFNLAASAFGLDRGAVLCIDCFVEGHEKATGLSASWTLTPGVFRPVHDCEDGWMRDDPTDLTEDASMSGCPICQPRITRRIS